MQSVGHRTVSAYLHVDSSVKELIMALGSEQTNLTCNVIKNQYQELEGGGEVTRKSLITLYLGFSWLICEIAHGSIGVVMSMIPE